MAKKTVSSFLSADFGVEDLISGRFSSSPNMKDYDVLNKLGILAPLKDRNNTDPTSFALESASLLAESESFGVFASQQLNELNNRFALCNRIKRTYGIEGFDPLAIGMEGIGETFKKIGSAIVAAFKKLGAMIMNFVRSVGNALGSAVALTQVKLYENNKTSKFSDDKGKTIKAIPHVKSFKEVFKNLEEGIRSASSDFAEYDKMVADLVNSGLTGKSSRDPFDGKKCKHKLSTALAKAFKKDMEAGEDFFQKLDVKKAVKTEIFGKSDVSPSEYKCGEYINKCADKVELLSRQVLEQAKVSVKSSQIILKQINFSLKQIDSLMKMSQKFEGNKAIAGSKENAKSNTSVMKQIREAFNTSNVKRFAVTKMQTKILMTFSYFLKCRGYMAAAVKGYDKETKKKK